MPSLLVKNSEAVGGAPTDTMATPKFVIPPGFFNQLRTCVVTSTATICAGAGLVTGSVTIGAVPSAGALLNVMPLSLQLVNTGNTATVPIAVTLAISINTLAFSISRSDTPGGSAVRSKSRNVLDVGLTDRSGELP